VSNALSKSVLIHYAVLICAVIGGAAHIGYYKYNKLEQKKFLVCWDDVPKESKTLIRFLKLLKYTTLELDIKWAENAEIRKSGDNKTITISEAKNTLEIILDEDKKRAILKIRNGATHNLKVKKENNKLNIYKTPEPVFPQLAFFARQVLRLRESHFH